MQILGGCKWNRNSVYFFKYSLGLCCQKLSLPSLSPYLPRFPRCCCQTLCSHCPCPYFPPWPLLPSRPFLGLYLVHCASVWFLRLSFGFVASILPVMMLTRPFPAARCPALRSLSLLCLIVLSPFPNLSLLLTEAFQDKVNTNGTRADPAAPSCFISPPLPLPGMRRWQSPGLVTRFPALQIPLLQNKISDTFLKYRYSKLWPLFLPYLWINNVEKEFKDVFQTGPSFF